jgi:phosphoribosylglycinamide formyltransferase-1
VISNRSDAAGLGIAIAHGIATAVVDHRGCDRPRFEAGLQAALERSACDLVVLAGFMRILSAPFVQQYAGRMINIHPSLLPAFGGLHTHRRALEEGVRIHGCTVHFVTADLDHGPIVAQGAVGVLDDDDEEGLGARVLAVEHRLLPWTVRAFCEGRLVIEGNRVRVKGGLPAAGVLTAPSLD